MKPKIMPKKNKQGKRTFNYTKQLEEQKKATLEETELRRNKMIKRLINLRHQQYLYIMGRLGVEVIQ